MRAFSLTLTLYLSRVIGRGILVALAALSLLALAIELREEAPALLAHGGPGALTYYAVLTLPGIVHTVAPIALLAGAILGFAMLARRGEAVILRAAGLSTLRIFAALLPLGLILGAALHLLDDWGLPAAEAARAAEFVAMGEEAAERATVWLRTPDWVLRAAPVAEDGTRLAAVTVFDLDAAGGLTRRIDAREARHEDGTWRLADAVETETSTGIATRAAVLDWPSTLVPEDVRTLARRRQVPSGAEVASALAGERVMTRPRSFYEARAARTFSLVAMPSLLILLASPVVLGSGRGTGALAQTAAIAALLGLAFVVGEGLVASLSEKGLIAPALAAWVPAGAALLLGLWSILRAEG
ncbi:MAG: LptF/LptG family permease [Pseudomonadota bacterium]